MFSATGKRRRTSMTSTASKDDDAGSVDMEYPPDTKRKKVIKLDPVRSHSEMMA